jgi:hypothetical protein
MQITFLAGSWWYIIKIINISSTFISHTLYSFPFTLSAAIVLITFRHDIPSVVCHFSILDTDI